jgi:hypothetical protein
MEGMSSKDMNAVRNQLQHGQGLIQFLEEQKAKQPKRKPMLPGAPNHRARCDCALCKKHRVSSAQLVEATKAVQQQMAMQGMLAPAGAAAVTATSTTTSTTATTTTSTSTSTTDTTTTAAFATPSFVPPGL